MQVAWRFETSVSTVGRRGFNSLWDFQYFNVLVRAIFGLRHANGTHLLQPEFLLALIDHGEAYAEAVCDLSRLFPCNNHGV